MKSITPGTGCRILPRPTFLSVHRIFDDLRSAGEGDGLDPVGGILSISLGEFDEFKASGSSTKGFKDCAPGCIK